MSTSLHSNTSRNKNTEENDDEDDESVAYICTECWNQLDKDNREMWDRCELSDAQSSPRGAHLQLVARKDELEEHLLPMIQWNRTSAKQWHATISRPKPNDSTQQGPTRYNKHKDGNSDNSSGKDRRSTRRLAAYVVFERRVRAPYSSATFEREAREFQFYHFLLSVTSITRITLVSLNLCL